MSRWNIPALIGALTALASRKASVPIITEAIEVTRDPNLGLPDYVIKAHTDSSVYVIKAHTLRKHNDDVWRTKNKRGIRRTKKGKRK